MKNVEENSIVRKIWSDPAVVLLIFAGASGEFALHKTVDWLFFTGKLPTDPIGRMCSTLAYARQIIFMDETQSRAAIAKINAIHGGIENKRQESIPNWAYKDVLYMLIEYSILAFEQVRRELSAEEKGEILAVFRKVGEGMHIKDLPRYFDDWRKARNEAFWTGYTCSANTKRLFSSYRKQLGFFRYNILLEMQKLLLPKALGAMLNFSRPMFVSNYWIKKVLFRLLSTALVFCFLPRQFKRLFS